MAWLKEIHVVIILKRSKKMNKNDFNLLAIKVMEQERQSKERALERLDMMEDVCLISGKRRLIPQVMAARLFIQRNY